MQVVCQLHSDPRICIYLVCLPPGVLPYVQVVLIVLEFLMSNLGASANNIEPEDSANCLALPRYGNRVIL